MVIKLSKTVFLAIAAVLLLVSTAVNVVPVSSIIGSTERDLPVVMYHQLTKNQKKSGKYVLTVEQFEKDLMFLKSKGYQSVTVKQLIEFSQGKGDIPEKSILITFDDGQETLYEYALPLLEKYGFTAVGFVVGALADYYTEIDDHNLSYSYLNWQQIKEMSEGNIIEIESHSFDLHKNTGNRSGIKKKKEETVEQYREFLCSDVAKMKTAMENNTGKNPVAFAFPFGSFSRESTEILKECGFKMTLTCEERVNKIKKAEPESLFGLGRYNRPEGISSESFFEKMGIS
ncbi:MAG: polysaccharide deacetylase family protein [Clostridia bacterium]|nr:polysaccharide deacetylase family protein [Clostridia bacterium]